MGDVSGELPFQQQASAVLQMECSVKLGGGPVGRVALYEDESAAYAVKEFHEYSDPLMLDGVIAHFESLKRLMTIHPNLVTIHEVIKFPAHRRSVVLEYCAGGSVAQRLSARGPLEPRVAGQVCLDVLRGLQVLHRDGITHQCLKSSNLLFDLSGTVKLSDPGLCCLESLSDSNIWWMAPKAVVDNVFTRFGDVWSLGCSFLEMLTGSPPFRHPFGSNMERFSAFLRDPHRDVATIYPIVTSNVPLITCFSETEEADLDALIHLFSPTARQPCSG
eukprot:TRINITY_DN4713_c0_g1_i2.p1 TRINITY_DN4713_c0_g1~~TRINITY_DN4713_c0_g1_i2.p1  ORF type:complete len:275 (+),score=15.02 TRINITY_DN4713_c0_g1_i2:3-827(+)